MSRDENSLLVATAMIKYLNEVKGGTNYKPKDFIRGGLFHHYERNKEDILQFIKWLWKNNRKAFYALSFWQGGYENRTTPSFETAIHENWGEGGYLPFFSDTPDYYYIYC